jgi:hypothetical protein
MAIEVFDIALVQLQPVPLETADKDADLAATEVRRPLPGRLQRLVHDLEQESLLRVHRSALVLCRRPKRRIHVGEVDMVEEIAKLGADVAGLSRAIPVVDVVTRLWYLASPIPLVLE